MISSFSGQLKEVHREGDKIREEKRWLVLDNNKITCFKKNTFNFRRTEKVCYFSLSLLYTLYINLIYHKVIYT